LAVALRSRPQQENGKGRMTTEERKQKLVDLGAVIARQLLGFYGNVQFNIQNGVFINGSINEGFKPENQENRK
jgi:hypothetical protein